MLFDLMNAIHTQRHRFVDASNSSTPTHLFTTKTARLFKSLSLDELEEQRHELTVKESASDFILDRELDRRKTLIRRHNKDNGRIPIDRYYPYEWTFNVLRDINRDNDPDIQPVLIIFITRLPSNLRRNALVLHNIPSRMEYNLQKGVAWQALLNPFPGQPDFIFAAKLINAKNDASIKITDFWTPECNL